MNRVRNYHGTVKSIRTRVSILFVTRTTIPICFEGVTRNPYLILVRLNKKALLYETVLAVLSQHTKFPNHWEQVQAFSIDSKMSHDEVKEQ